MEAIGPGEEIAGLWYDMSPRPGGCKGRAVAVDGGRTGVPGVREGGGNC